MSSIIQSITLNVANMTCVNCENIIERTLSKTPGIVNCKASYSRGMVIVNYDAGIITPEKIINALSEEGYQAIFKTAADNAAGHPVNAADNPPGRTEHGNIPQFAANSNGKNTGRSGEHARNAAQGRDFSDIIGIIIIIFAIYVIANHFGIFNLFNSFPVAKEGMGYGMLFLIGILTSIHCVAMCGGICLSQCVPQKEGSSAGRLSALRPSILYNFGRVVSYTVIGGIVGAIGSVVSFSGSMKGIVQILAGIFMVIMGINMLNIFPWLRRLNPRMPKVFARKIYSQSAGRSPLYIGLLNGLMPCGPLQAMQLYALSTGSPLKGAISMFLFSIGTVPLMFVFGALSSFLSKKFTAKMMTASAVLVVFLGIFMFNSGISLSGIVLPSFPALAASPDKQANVASIQGDVQLVTSGITSGSYEPIVVQKGIPVRWTLQAEQGDINGCNNSIIIRKYNIQKNLQVGDNIIEFTPEDSGTVTFSCWMGMIRSKITVVDDLDGADAGVTGDAGSTGSNAAAGSDPGGAASDSDEDTGLDQFNNLLEAELPTDEIGVAAVQDGTQTIAITYDGEGLSPAIIVVQEGLETEWNIQADNVDSSKGTLLFPYYWAQLSVKQGDNPIKFIPDQDFDFYSSDYSYFGLVKVVEDINNIDIDAIKKEAENYQPTDISSYDEQGACH